MGTLILITAVVGAALLRSSSLFQGKPMARTARASVRRLPAL
jgi:hypothetical protein